MPSLLKILASVTALALVAVTALVCFTDFPYDATTSSIVMSALTSRQLQQREPIGVVTLDFYNTFGQNSFGGKQYAMPNWRIDLQMVELNAWYVGNVVFKTGNKYEYDNPRMYEVPAVRDGPCIEIRKFADSSTPQRDDRISVVLSNNINSDIMISCVSEKDLPLGKDRNAAFILRNDFKSLFGGGIAHGVGRLFGFGYTSDDFLEGVHTYKRCGLTLKYPYFRLNNFFDNEVTVDGVTYNNNDWMGRQNLMARFHQSGITLFWGVITFSLGVYINNYGPIFKQITACWFARSKKSLGITTRELARP